jgi:3-oxoacyl-[acyl-carrier-protein] synthase II
VDVDDVWAVSDSGIGGFAGDWERQSLAAKFGGDVLDRAPSIAAIGETAAASAAFQVAALLSAAEKSAAPAGSVALVSSVDEDGLVAVAALRLL